MKTVTGPQVITRYNNYRSVTINGSSAPGLSSGSAIQAMARLQIDDIGSRWLQS